MNNSHYSAVFLIFTGGSTSGVMVKRVVMNICVNLTDHQYSDTLKLKYIPKSLSNRLMYYIYSDTVYPGAMKRLIDQLRGPDRREDSPYTEQFRDDSQSSHHQLQPNRRKYSTCVLKVTPEILCHRMHVNVQKVQNCTHTNNSLYRTFK